MSEDELREAAEMLWKASGDPAEMVSFHRLSEAHRDEYRRMAAVVLADRERYARQRAAEELRAAAEEDAVTVTAQYPGAAPMTAVKTGALHDRADALTSEVSS